MFVFLFCKQIVIIILSVVLLIAAAIQLQLIPSLPTLVPIQVQGKNARTQRAIHKLLLEFLLINPNV